MNKSGFTLIELVMVIVILGILAAVAIPKFIDLKTEAKIAACQADVGAIRSSLTNYYAQFNVGNGTCPGGAGVCNTTSGYPIASQLAPGSTYFGPNFFTDGTLPKESDITATTKDWSAYYNESSGVINMADACARP